MMEMWSVYLAVLTFVLGFLVGLLVRWIWRNVFVLRCCWCGKFKARKYMQEPVSRSPYETHEEHECLECARMKHEDREAPK